MECIVNKPYPEIKVEGQNDYYADLLLNDYAGMSSELTSITQYVFQDFYYFHEYPLFASVMSQIAMVEMKHLELLGKTIRLLGKTPEFKYPTHSFLPSTYWSGNYVNYQTYLTAMLQADILLEETSIRNYRYDITEIHDINIQNLLMRIIEDEEVHIRCFRELLQYYSQS